MSEKDLSKFDTYTPQKSAAYSNSFADFLGGKEALKRINIYGHRIIYCMVEMLKTVQVFKPSYQDIYDKMQDEMVIDLASNRITTTSELNQQQVEARRVLEAGKKLAIIEEKYFADNFSMLQFVITTKALNDNGNIKVKTNALFREQLEVLKTLGSHIVESNDKKERMFTNFIENPIFDKGSSYVRFYISKTVADMLLNNINGYSNVYRTVVFNNITPQPFNISLYLVRKFGKMNGGTIKIDKFLDDCNLSEYYLKPSNLNPFLQRIKDALDLTGGKSFGFSIKKDKTISFALYDTTNTIGVELKDEDKYKCSNALKYIKKKRKLTTEQMEKLKRRFDIHKYEKMSVITGSRASKGKIGDEYYEWFISECDRLKLLDDKA